MSDRDLILQHLATAAQFIRKNDSTIEELNLQIADREAKIKQSENEQQKAEYRLESANASIKAQSLANEASAAKIEQYEVEKQWFRNRLDSEAEKIKELALVIESRDATITQSQKEKEWFTSRLNADAAAIKELETVISERDVKISQLDNANTSLSAKWDTERATVIRESQAVVDTLEADLIKVKRQYDAHVDKTSGQIEKLNASLESAVKETGTELDQLKRENERLITDINTKSAAFGEDLRQRDAELQELTKEIQERATESETRFNDLLIKLSDESTARQMEREQLISARNAAQEKYLAEHDVVMRIWDKLGYDMANGTPAKSIFDLIQDKDVEITALSKAGEAAAYTHLDRERALIAQVETLNKRHDAMEGVIERYRGLQDQSGLIARMADAMEREQYSGSGEDIPELIAEARKQALAVK